MACQRVGARAVCQRESPGIGAVKLAEGREGPATHDDRDEARVGVVRNRAKEPVLVHVRCGEECGACLVYDHDDLPATRTPHKRSSIAVSTESTLG